MRHLANCLTAARIVLAVCLLGTEAGSPAFFTLYTAAGLTDLLDGPAARRTESQSAFGARLDSAADLVFFAAASVCLLPCLWRLLPPAVWLGRWRRRWDGAPRSGSACGGMGVSRPCIPG